MVRIFVICPMNCIRMYHRRWENQNFGEAMGELFREMTDGTVDMDPVCTKGIRLNLIVVFFHFCETCWLWYGWHLYDTIQVCDDTIMQAAESMLSYQMFNVMFFAVLVDFLWPWFYMEFQHDVDTITKFKKAPPKPKDGKKGVMKKDANGKTVTEDPDSNGQGPDFVVPDIDGTLIKCARNIKAADSSI